MKILIIVSAYLYRFGVPARNGACVLKKRLLDEPANILQVCLDSGAKKVLIPAASFADFSTVPSELTSAFQIITYSSAEDGCLKRWALNNRRGG